MLSKADVVNRPFLKIGGHTTSSSTYYFTTVSPSCPDISNTLSYDMLIPFSCSLSISSLFLVFAKTFIPTYTVQLMLFHGLWHAFKILNLLCTWSSSYTAAVAQWPHLIAQHHGSDGTLCPPHAQYCKQTAEVPAERLPLQSLPC